MAENLASGKNHPPPSRKINVEPFSGKKSGQLFSASFLPFYREKNPKTWKGTKKVPNNGKYQKNNLVKAY